MQISKSFIFLINTFVLAILISCGQISNDEKFANGAKEYTERYCPKPLDESVILDSVVYHIPQGDKEGVYSYYHSVRGDSTDMQNLKEHQNELYDELLSRINNTQDLKQIKDCGIIIEYVFYSLASKEIVLDFNFTKENYK